jgi:hypothetical protein
MKVYYNGFDYEVEGSYTPGVRPTYARDYIEDEGAPATFDIESAIRIDSTESGESNNLDVTDQMSLDQAFIDFCLLEYERSES